MLNSERTLPSVTCMLLMLGTIKTGCQSFSVITPTSLTQSEHYAAVEELVKQLYCDSSRIWDSVELHKQYEVLDGKVLFTQTCLCYLHQVNYHFSFLLD